MKTLRLTILMIAAMALVFGATASNADVFTTSTFNIVNANAASGLGNGPFGTVTATLDTTNHQLAVTISMSGIYQIKSGNGVDVGFNGNTLSGFGYLAGSMAGSPDGGSKDCTATVTNNCTIVNIPGGNVSGFGNWAITFQHISDPSSLPSNNFTGLSFTLTGVNNLDSLNTNFAIHVVGANNLTGFATTVVTGGGCDANGNGCSNNGCSADDPSCGVTTQTPEPASLVLLGSGLLGIGGISRKRFAKKAF
jgi:hypothetical protein